MKRALTILHLLPFLNFGGVEKYVIGLSAALQARGHRCIIVSRGGVLEAQAAAAGVRHLRLELRGLRGLLAITCLARMIDREQVDLLNAHNWSAGAVGYLAARLARVPYVFTVHGVRSPLQRLFVYYWGRRVIAVSDTSRRHLVERFGLPSSRVVASVIGVDTDHFRPRAPAAHLIHELRLTPGAPTIVHVSRFSRGKAEVALRLLEAAPILDRRAPGFQAIIAGAGAMAGQVAAAVEAANRALGRRAFVFAGPRGDVADLMSLADVVIATATVAVEAMASGKPVVAAGKAGFSGMVTAESIDALGAACFGDHAAPEAVTAANLADAVAAALREPERAREAGEFGRRIAVRRFSLPRVAEEIEGIYREFLAGGRPVRRIAVLHLNQLGDLIFSLPALAALRQQFPRAEVVSLVRPSLLELMQDCPAVDRVLARPSGVAANIRLALALRRLSFDVAVALSQSVSAGVQAWATRAPLRVGFADSDGRLFLNRLVHVRGLPWPGKLARVSLCLGARDAPSTYVGLLRVPEHARDRAQRLLAQSGVGDTDRIAVLAPGASGRRRHKAWRASGFAAVGDHLRERWRRTVVIVGGAGDAVEAGRVAGMMSEPALNLCGRTTTGELAAILERADLLVGVDSGPLHVAAALGAPVVGLFGPTDPRRTGPQGEGQVVVSAGLACSPCSRPCEARACMEAITAEQVIAAVDRRLGLQSA